MALFYPPMLATLWRREWPDHWYYEVKWDGIRALLYLEEDGWRLVSRRGQLLNQGFSALGQLRSHFSQLPAVLDGELIAFDQQGRISFNAILKQMQGQTEQPWYYQVFDCLQLGEPLLSLPLAERRARLLPLFPHHPQAGLVSVYEGREQGLMLWQKIEELKFEGIVIKDPASPYLPGKRSQHWLKVKREQVIELPVLGYTSENRPVSALVLGDDSGKLIRGKVNCTLPAPDYRQLVKLLSELTVSREGAYCRILPRLLARVAYLETTPAGQLRHPRLLALLPREEKLWS